MDRLQTEHELVRYALCTADGEIGSAEHFYFDDAQWVIRYLVVKTGGWLKGRQVLIPPAATGEVDEEQGSIEIRLTREQIENSPPVETGKPVSRQYEEEYYRYYGWPPYWQRPPLPAAQSGSQNSAGEQHLRSTAEVRGYEIAAADGEVGRVKDFVIDTQDWAIRYLAIDTGNWFPGRQVLVNPAWINGVSWAERAVSVDLTREAIMSAPAYDPSQVIGRDYEVQLFKHYGRAVYWPHDDAQDE